MKHRIYRLSALLEARGCCGPWLDFVRQVSTATGVLARINASPSRRLDPAGPKWGVAYDARVFFYELAELWSCGAVFSFWQRQRWTCGTPNEAPLSHEEVQQAIALWRSYADVYGLYEDIEVCDPIEHAHLMPGWGCCVCKQRKSANGVGFGTYNGEPRQFCKACGHKRCDVRQPGRIVL